MGKSRVCTIPDVLQFAHFWEPLSRIYPQLLAGLSTWVTCVGSLFKIPGAGHPNSSQLHLVTYCSTIMFQHGLIMFDIFLLLIFFPLGSLLRHGRPRFTANLFFVRPESKESGQVIPLCTNRKPHGIVIDQRKQSIQVAPGYSSSKIQKYQTTDLTKTSLAGQRHQVCQVWAVCQFEDPKHSRRRSFLLYGPLASCRAKALVPQWS